MRRALLPVAVVAGLRLASVAIAQDPAPGAKDDFTLTWKGDGKGSTPAPGVRPGPAAPAPAAPMTGTFREPVVAIPSARLPGLPDHYLFASASFIGTNAVVASALYRIRLPASRVAFGFSFGGGFGPTFDTNRSSNFNGPWGPSYVVDVGAAFDFSLTPELMIGFGFHGVNNVTANGANLLYVEPEAIYSLGDAAGGLSFLVGLPLAVVNTSVSNVQVSSLALGVRAGVGLRF